MSDSSRFNSLLDLVDSHLSQCKLQDTVSDNNQGTSSAQFDLQRDSSLSGLVIPPRERLIPRYTRSDSPIQNVLALQISNMLKAKEKKEQEEKDNLEQEMKNMSLKKEKDEYVIDLMQAIQRPAVAPNSKFLSGSVKSKNMFKGFGTRDIMDSYAVRKHYSSPYMNDVSHVFSVNIKKAKCSRFGKVLSARLKSIPAPYLRMKTANNRVARFNFGTKSPCDIIQEHELELEHDPALRMKEYVSIMDIIMGEPFPASL